MAAIVGRGGPRRSDPYSWEKVTTQKKHLHGKKLFSAAFYLENIPLHIDNKALRQLIHKRWSLPSFSKLEDVFIPHKRNKKGKRYGFVEMSGLKDIKEMVLALDSKDIGASRLRCSLSRRQRDTKQVEFRKTYPKILSSRIVERIPKLQPKKTKWGQSNPVKRWIPTLNTDDEEQRVSDFDNMWPKLPSLEKSATQEVDELMSIPLTIPAENRSWLNNCLIGVMKKIEYMADIQSRVQNLGWKCAVVVLGSGMVSLEFSSDKDMREACDDNRDAVLDIFFKVLPWRNVVTESGRCVWLRCTGIPIQSWGKVTFESIGNAVGSFITSDETTQERKRMDLARILVVTDKTEIDLKIRGELEGVSFIIHCKEEPPTVWSPLKTRTEEPQREGEVYAENSDGGSNVAATNRRVRENVSEETEIENTMLFLEERILEEAMETETRNRRKPAKKVNHVSKRQNTQHRVSLSHSLPPPPPDNPESVPDINLTVIDRVSQSILESEGEGVWPIGERMRMTDRADREEIIRFDKERRAAEAARRGLAAASKKRALRDLISQQKVDFCMVQETKKESIDEFFMNSIWGEGDVRFCFSPSNGRAGGLISAWKSDLFEASRLQIFDKYIWVEGLIRKTNFPCVMVNVYAPNDGNNRKRLWDEIKAKVGSSPHPVMVAGDFNEVISTSDRLNCNTMNSSMRDFVTWINSCGLLDLNLTNRKYTWSNSISRSKIDRMLIQVEWNSILTEFSLKALAKSGSDHTPLMLSKGKIDWGPKPFKTIEAWWSNPDFEKRVELWWVEAGVLYPGNFAFITKMKWLKKKLSVWNKEEFGKMENNLKSLKDRVDQLDCLADERSLNGAELEEKAGLLSSCNNLQKDIDRLWLIKSRERWNTAGDKNSKFFQTVAKIKSNSNLFSEIIYKDQKLSSPASIKNAAAEYFENFFKADVWNRPRCTDLGFKRLDAEVSKSLEEEVTESEIIEAVKNCGSDKSPGPDGFTFFFIQKAWKIIGKEFCVMVSEFFKNSKFPAGATASFLTIIPKFKPPQVFSDFRPISLVSSYYKVIAKILSMRLASIMPELISNVQHGFRKGFQTLDCVMTASEVINHLERKKKKGVLFKIDFEKAYDSVDWGFLLDVMELMGFGVRWRDWIMQCLKSTSVSVLINGSPSREFTTGRGLRQGCPLSPFLFNLVGEVLHLILNRAAEVDLIKEVKDEVNGWKVGHIQFADDTLIFLENLGLDLSRIKSILRWFEAFSGLRINFFKSSLIGINWENRLCEEAAQRIGCKVEKFPVPYLGSFIGFKPRRISSWDFLIDKIKKKLATWKGKLLSLGGRITLINSVLRSLPIYNMSIYRMPLGVVDKCETIMKAFLWSGDDRNRFLSKVKWKEVIKPINHGGLGIGSLQTRNEAFLLKWIWQLIDDNQKIWVDIVRARYGVFSPGSFWAKEGNGESVIWQDIRKVWGSKGSRKDIWLQNMISRVGDGARSKFWWDQWLTDNPLAQKYPRLYSKSVDKEGSVTRTGEWENGVWSWKVDWSQLNIEEQEDLRSLHEMLNNYQPGTDKDLFKWRSSKDGGYDVESCTSAIDSNSMNLEENYRLANCWRNKVPQRIATFCWLVLRNRIATVDFLQRRHIVISNPTCVECGEDGEAVSHIMLNCRFAVAIWNRIRGWLNIQGVLHEDVTLVWDGWMFDSHLFKKEARIWFRMLIYAIFWHLWKRRNDKLFNQKTESVEVTFYSIFNTWFCWIKSFFPSFPYSYDCCTMSSIWIHVWDQG